ncbi:MAG: hypothetical protein ACKVP0_04290 [Pirellulaceae bacterium]
MAGYVPIHRKKRDRLERLEDELRRLMARGAPEDELIVAALAIQQGRIRVLPARQNKNKERTAREREEFLADAARIKGILTLSPEQILAEYRLVHH